MTWEVRPAQKGEILRQKEIWKLCFGDPDSYIDFFYAKRYKEDETAVLLQNGEITAMLTMIPVRTVLSDNRSLKTAMLYAIATHPAYQRRGLAARLMDFTDQYLRERKTEFAVLVPAEKSLFEFYRRQGYQDGFYLRETRLTGEEAESLPGPRVGTCLISELKPDEYNRRRNRLLQGRRFISYADADIAYQKDLSRRTGADIYGLDLEGVQGCCVVERIAADKVLVKEILIPEDFLSLAVKEVVRQLLAKEYFFRTSPHLGEQLDWFLRPFGMFRTLGENESEAVKMPNDYGYLGFAFD